MSIDALYKNVAIYYNITIKELHQRIVNGEKLIHKYYVDKGYDL